MGFFFPKVPAHPEMPDVVQCLSLSVGEVEGSAPQKFPLFFDPNSSRIFGDFRCHMGECLDPRTQSLRKIVEWFLEDWCQCHSGPGCSEQMHLSCCYAGARIQTMLKRLLTRSLGKFYQNFHAFCQSQSKSMPVSSI